MRTVTTTCDQCGTKRLKDDLGAARLPPEKCFRRHQRILDRMERETKARRKSAFP